ncbi:hypothetical protein NVP1039O_04 [Vibrio phage 1.039.O._10N.286.55.A2]|nr:hypothetical protein NVP1039O_04 [Vibrio phage 1.039.O._10N.286.55.A2]
MTYDSFEAAKIANPESDIYELNGVFQPGHMKCRNGESKCNPSKHCMTVEKFLADGHKFIEGDVVLDVSDVEVITTQLDVGAYNQKDKTDVYRYILSAEALKPSDNDYAMSVMEKKVKVEYVQEVSFKEVLKCAIDGEVFYSKDGKGEFRFDVSRMSFVNHDGADMKIANLTYHEFYRRIETPIEWWEDASEFVNQTDDVNCSSIMEGELHVNATLTRKQWCDFARTLLEQGE